MHIYIYIYIYLFIYLLIYLFMYFYSFYYIYIFVYSFVLIHIYNICLYVDTYTHTHLCVYLSTYTDPHAYTYVLMCRDQGFRARLWTANPKPEMTLQFGYYNNPQGSI